MPLLAGINEAKDLCHGETLCGACQDACPVNIDIPRMLLALRNKLAEGDPNWGVSRSSSGEKLAYQIWSWMISNRFVYDWFLRLTSIGQNVLPNHNGMIRRLPPLMHGWTRHRDIQPVAGESFMSRWKKGL